MGDDEEDGDDEDDDEDGDEKEDQLWYGAFGLNNCQSTVYIVDSTSLDDDIQQYWQWLEKTYHV